MAEGTDNTIKDASSSDLSGNAQTAEKPAWDDSHRWGLFIKSLFVYFILTLLMGVFGSGFIYLTTRGSDIDIILPTNNEFYTAPQFEIEKSGPMSEINCNETPGGMFTGIEDNFPYNLIRTKGESREELKKLTFVERIVNWFAKTVAGCFKTNRALLKGWLDNFPPDSPLGNHTFQIYIACPFTILISWVGLITGFWCALGSGSSADMKVTVWGGFLLYAWGVCLGLAGIVFLRFLGTICFFPMSENWKEVANIMGCNVKSLVALFGFFACGSAYDTLDPTVAGIMGITYLMLVVYSLWKYFSNQLH